VRTLTKAGPGEALIIRGMTGAGTVVLAAIDDDGKGAAILAYARRRACRLRTPLRVVHVWTGRWYDQVSDSDRLLSDLLQDLPPGETAAVERQILHDDDPARALIELSREAALLVMSGGSTRGRTVRRLAGRTWCPLAVVPVAPVRTERW
jgi:K+-sensing histidine kinase KdpD